MRALLSEKRSLKEASEVVSSWEKRLLEGHPVEELYTDWDWGYDGEYAARDDEGDEDEGA